MLKHLTLDDRIVIETSLKEGKSFKEIGRLLGKDPTTISKEVKKHSFEVKSGCFGRSYNACALRRDCDKRRLCNNPNCKFKMCKNCSLCNSNCSEFIEIYCQKLHKSPYVCNGCDSKQTCSIKKNIYKAVNSHKQYELTLYESRSGVPVNEDELRQLDNIISPLIKQGQSIHHICTSNADRIMFSEKTIYNYVDSNLLSAINLDLPRKVRLKPRKKPGTSHKIDRKCRINRTYQDYLLFMKENGYPPVVQMDTVEGKKGGKVLLTLLFKEAQFMVLFLRDANDSQSVIDTINYLYEVLGEEAFRALFPVIITDNGSEFSNPNAIEFDKNGKRRTYLFYCDPSAPYQKGALENNHEFIRKIIPKGKSFDELTQNHIDLVMNHINSYARKKLNDKSPYEIFVFLYGKDILEILGVKLISPNDINLTPNLIK